MKKPIQLPPIVAALRRLAHLSDEQQSKTLDELYDLDPYAYKKLREAIKRWMQEPV